MRRCCVACLALVLAGCGGGHRARTSSAAAKLAIARRTHEYPSPPAPAQSAVGDATSAQAAIRSFASAYINWSADTVAGDMRMLASRSVGQARSAMQLAAAQTAADYQLQQGGIANSGTVEAVAPRAGVADQFVVVTREQTTAADTTAYQGLRPAWHVTVATVTSLGQGQWVVSGWQPEV